MLRDQNTRLFIFDWFVSEQDDMKTEAYKGVSILYAFIYFTSLREQEKAYVNIL